MLSVVSEKIDRMFANDFGRPRSRNFNTFGTYAAITLDHVDVCHDLDDVFRCSNIATVSENSKSPGDPLGVRHQLLLEFGISVIGFHNSIQ